MIKPEFVEILQKEGNYKEFKIDNYECKIKRIALEYSGHLCGYVKIPKEHGLYLKDYHEIDVNVHGGLTYSSNEKDGYWIGFDCAHYHDKLPCYIGSPRLEFGDEVYRNMEYVENEIKNLVKQIKALA